MRAPARLGRARSSSRPTPPSRRLDFAPRCSDLPELGLATVGDGRIPALTPFWECTSLAGAFFAGNAMQGAAGLRKHGIGSASGTVSGFRYNARILARQIARRLGTSPERHRLAETAVLPRRRARSRHPSSGRRRAISPGPSTPAEAPHRPARPLPRPLPSRIDRGHHGDERGGRSTHPVHRAREEIDERQLPPHHLHDYDRTVPTRELLVAPLTLLVAPARGAGSPARLAGLDLHWENQPAHFWLVLAVGVLSGALAFLLGEAAARRADARVLACRAGFSSARRASSACTRSPRRGPARGKNAGFQVASAIGLLLAAPICAWSAVSRSTTAAFRLRPPLGPLHRVALHSASGQLCRSRRCRRSTSRSRGSRTASPLDLRRRRSSSYGFGARLLHVFTSGDGARCSSRSVAALVLLARRCSRSPRSNWHLTWWEWHLLMLLAFGLVARAAWRGMAARGLARQRSAADLYEEATLGRQEEVSVFFADLQGFTGFSENHGSARSPPCSTRTSTRPRSPRPGTSSQRPHDRGRGHGVLHRKRPRARAAGAALAFQERMSGWPEPTRMAALPRRPQLRRASSASRRPRGRRRVRGRHRQRRGPTGRPGASGRGRHGGDDLHSARTEPTAEDLGELPVRERSSRCGLRPSRASAGRARARSAPAARAGRTRTLGSPSPPAERPGADRGSRIAAPITMLRRAAPTALPAAVRGCRADPR